LRRSPNPTGPRELLLEAADYGISRGERLRDRIDASWVLTKELWEEYVHLKERAGEITAGLHFGLRLMKEVFGLERCGALRWLEARRVELTDHPPRCRWLRDLYLAEELMRDILIAPSSARKIPSAHPTAARRSS
jgi:hypothetical protein